MTEMGAAEPWTTSRRQFLKIGGTMVAGAAFAACGSGGSGGGGDAELLVGATPDYESIIKPMVARYNRQNPGGPKVKVRMYPADTGQYFDRLRTQFQAGDADLDLFAGDVSWPAQFAVNGWITDLSKQFPEPERSQFIPGAIEGDTYEGKCWGVPWFTDSGFLYYRADLLERSGFSEAPTTWAELMEMAAKVQRDANVPNGFVFTGAIYEGGTVLGTEFVRTAGGDVLDGNTPVVSSPQAVEGLRIQQSLVAEGVAPKAVANFKEDEASAAFVRGEAVFMRMWPYAYDLLTDKQVSDIEQRQVGLAAVPRASADVAPVNVGGGWSFFVNKASGNQDAAWKLAQFLTAEDQQKTMAIEGAYLPTRTALYDDPAVAEKLPAIKQGKDVVEATTTPPVSPYYSDLSAAMAKQFNANVLGSRPAEEIAGELQEELQAIADRAG